MQTTFRLDTPLHVAILVSLLVLLAGQVILLVRSQRIPPGRRALRAGLNALLWLLVLAFVLRPAWPVTEPATHALLVGEDVPGALARRVKDSLQLKDSFTARTFKADYDSVTLLGQQFPTETLTGLSSTAVRWIPYNAPGQIRDLRWHALVQQGERQRITGRLLSAGKQTLAVRYGSQLLDSLTLREGENQFSLQFPAVARGRMQTELVLNQDVIDTIRFFSRALEPLTVQFVLNSPDFESKTLADWLGKQGHTVNLSATLSRNVSRSISINPTAKSSAKAPDLLITDPTNAADAGVRKAVAEGRAVLFINLTNPEADCQTINRALASRWQVRRTTNTPTVSLGNGLNALPYRFVESLNQFPVAGYPIAVQRNAGRVGVSLLSETFPLALSGDSLTYSRVWTAVLAQLSPTSQNNLRAEAPVYAGLRQSITVNNPTGKAQFLTVGADTAQLVQSALNPQSAAGAFLTGTPGWQPVADSLAMFIEPVRPGNAGAEQAVVRRFMLAHANQPVTAGAGQRADAQLPDWAWLLLFVGVLTALWVEPKL